MTSLGTSEYETVMAALRGDKFDRAVFERATRKMMMGSGIRPKGVFLDRDIPRSLKEWRRDQQWSIEFVNRHQSACDSSWREYWRVMTSNAEVSGLSTRPPG